MMSTPPITSTAPFASKVAVCPERAVVILLVRAKAPLVESNSSALARDVDRVFRKHPFSTVWIFVQPTTRTLPSESSVAVWCARDEDIFPVAEKLAVLLSNRNAPTTDSRPTRRIGGGQLLKKEIPLTPPARSTLPSASNVAVRKVVVGCPPPVDAKVLLTGSNMSP